MPDCSSLHVVQLTPPGRGAVATLLIEGGGAEEMVQQRFQAKSGRPLASHPQDRLIFGYLTLLAGAPREEVVVRRHSPESVEIHCHGGLAAVRQIEQVFLDMGARIVSWQEWTFRHQADPITAAAQVALANARTERTARILLDQHQGALRRAIEDVRRALHLQDGTTALRQLEALLAHAHTGLHLVTPWRVVLAGPPNVGKSSLINALLGYRRAIVHPTPGTTRDAVTAITAMEGWPIELSDTAGLRTSDEAVEQAGIAIAQRRLASADLVVLVFDQSQPWSHVHSQLAAVWPKAVVLANKADLPSVSAASCPAELATSAKTGQGVERLIHTIAQRLVPVVPPGGAAVPFTGEQVAWLRAAYSAVEQRDFRKGRAALEPFG